MFSTRNRRKAFCFALPDPVEYYVLFQVGEKIVAVVLDVLLVAVVDVVLVVGVLVVASAGVSDNSHLQSAYIFFLQSHLAIHLSANPK